MSCCIIEGHNTIVTKYVWKDKHKNWGGIMERHNLSPSEIIHTIVGDLFQQL